ncbi:MAG: DUF3429 domain-containing protein [Cellvibrionales bacterium]|jgi:hypothetical protein|nr:DUF3429 domain-containing protein [Cellvibrionales bacterium]
MRNKDAFINLMYLGALPFIASAILSLLSIDTLPWLGSVVHIVSVYALVISVFMAGILWGIMLQVNRDNSVGQINFLISNILTLTVWFVYLIYPDSIAFLLTTAVVFLWLLMLDAKLVQEQHISKRYYQARKWVSTIVILSLLTIAAS